MSTATSAAAHPAARVTVGRKARHGRADRFAVRLKETGGSADSKGDGGPPDALRDQLPPMAKIPDKQGLFFELDGVLVEQARLDEHGEVPFIERAVEALTQVDPQQFRLLSLIHI